MRSNRARDGHKCLYPIGGKRNGELLALASPAQEQVSRKDAKAQRTQQNRLYGMKFPVLVVIAAVSAASDHKDIGALVLPLSIRL